jgi:hypothetical protein
MLYRLGNGIGEFGGAWGWESLSGDGLRDQKAAEVFFRWDVSPNFSLTPSVQALIDPALNQSNDIIVLGGIRARVSFWAITFPSEMTEQDVLARRLLGGSWR